MNLKSLLGIGNTSSANKAAYPTKASYNYQHSFVGASPVCDEGEPVPANCLPVEINKPYIRDLLRYMSDDDCSELLRAIVDSISKEGNDYKISKSIETSIIEFIISKG